MTLRRAFFLLVIGLFNTLIFSADIIHYYSFYFFIGAFMLPLSNRLLVVGIVVANLIFVLMMFTLNFDLGWDWSINEYRNFWSPAGFLRNLFFNGWHPVFPWIGFLLFGIILSRLELGEKALQLKMILLGLGLFVAVKFISTQLTFYAATNTHDLLLLIATKPVPPMPLYTLAGLGIACAAIGICLMISGWVERIGIARLIIPAGRQTLTLYFAHIPFGMGMMEELDMIGNQSLSVSLFSALIFCSIATIYALLWNKKFKRGAIESIMRKVAG